MVDSGFLAEFFPDFFWLSGRGGDVRGHIGPFIPEGFIPAVLVDFADTLPIGVTMLLPQIKSVDAPCLAVNNGIG
jgi:hypothetical protein